MVIYHGRKEKATLHKHKLVDSPLFEFLVLVCCYDFCCCLSVLFLDGGNFAPKDGKSSVSPASLFFLVGDAMEFGTFSNEIAKNAEKHVDFLQVRGKNLFGIT